MIAQIDDYSIVGFNTKEQLDEAVQEMNGVEFLVVFQGETTNIPLVLSEELFGHVADNLESFPSCVAEAFIETDYCLIYK